MIAPANPTEVVRHLSVLTEELRRTVSASVRAELKTLGYEESA